MSTKQQQHAHDLSYHTFEDHHAPASSSSRAIIIHPTSTHSQPLLTHNISTKTHQLTTRRKGCLPQCCWDCCFNLRINCCFILFVLLIPLCVSLGLIIGGHEVATNAYNAKLKAETFNVNGTCQCISTSNYTDSQGEIHYKATYIPLELFPCSNASTNPMNNEYTFDLHWTQNISHIEHCYTDTRCSEVFLCEDAMCNEYGVRYGHLMLVAIAMYVIAVMNVVGVFICGVLKGKDMKLYLQQRYLKQVNKGGVVSYYAGYGRNPDDDDLEATKLPNRWDTGR